MRKIYALLLAIFAFSAINLSAQVTVSGGTTAAGSYPSLSTAFSAINGTTLTGAVAVNVTASYTETATILVGGATLNPSTSSTNTITINGGGFSVTAMSPGTSTTVDGIIKIQGADYVTISNLMFQENAANTTATQQMEWGIAIVKLSATDGSQNINITGCTISLNKANAASVGIYGGNHIATATTSLTVSGAGGTNANIKVNGNTISNTYIGIQISGSTTAANYDTGLEVGSGTGNTITNYGGGSGTTYGLRVVGQASPKIENNTLTLPLGTTTTAYGINSATSVNGTFLINANTVTVAGSGTTSQVAAISSQATGTTTVNITNNIVENSSYPTATSGDFFLIHETGSTTGSTVNITGNIVRNNSYGGSAAGSGAYNLIYSTSGTGASAVNAINNQVYNNTATGTTGATMAGIYINKGSTQTMTDNQIYGNTVGGTGTSGIIYCIRSVTGTVVHSNNVIRDNGITKSTGTGAVYGVYNLASPTNETYSGNEIYNLTHAGTGLVTGINANTAAGTRTVSSNTIYGLSSQGGAVVGIAQALSSPNVFKNKIYDLISNGTSGTVFGISVTSGIVVNLYNNYIGKLSAPLTNNTSDAVRGISITSSTATSSINLSYNTIYLNATSSGADFNTSGIFHSHNATATTASLTMRNNIIVNVSTPNGSGKAAAFKRSAATDLNNYNTASNNNLFYVGAATSDKVLYYDGTNADASLVAFKARVAPRETNSIREEPPFLSTTGSSAQFLHIDPAVPTQIESGGIPVAGITDDFDGDVRNATTPDIGADEFAGTPAINMNYSSSNTVQQTGVAYIGNNQAIVRMDIVTSGASNPLMVNEFTVNANGTTNLADLANAKIYYTGGSSDFSTSTLFGSAVPSLSNFNIAGSQVLGEGNNYFWLAYDIAPTATSGNQVDGEFANVTIDGVSQTPTISAPTGSRTLVGPMAGVFNIGQGQTFPHFTSITQALVDLNGRGVGAGGVIFTLTNNAATPYSAANGEEFPLLINEIAGASAGNPIIFRPAPGMSPVITGSGPAIIKLNGADYVTFDGSNSGGADISLTISNTSTNAATTGVWVASLGAGLGATNNIIKNCIIETGTIASTTYGIHVSNATSITTTGTGEDNNFLTIQNNQVRKATYGIYARGVPTTGELTGLNITQNTIGSNEAAEYITDHGIQVYSAIAPGITNNEIFNLIANNSKYGIYMGTNISNAVISRNNIHGFGYTNTTNYIAYGIYFVSGTSVTNNQISNNIIYDLRAYGTTTATSGLAGIRIVGGDGFKIDFNTISLTDNIESGTAALSFGLYVSTSSTNMDVRNNVFYNARTGGALPKNYAIYTVTGTTYSSIDYNAYFTSNAVLGHIGGTDRADITAIRAGTSQDVHSISANPLLNTPTDVRPGLVSPLLGAGDNSTGIITDFLGATRNDPPTIGAYEQAADAAGPVISYVALANTSSTTNRTITATITDVSGVAGGANAPLIYYRKGNSGAFFAANATSVTGNDYTFTIDYINIGGATEGDFIQYYIAAQDALGNFSTSPTGGTGSNPPGTAAPASPDQYRIVANYVWQGGTGDYQVAANWLPVRTTPDATDLLTFDGTVTPVTTVNNIPTQTVASLTFINNIDAALNSSSSNTLSINGATGVSNLNIDAGSSVHLGTTTQLTLNFTTTTGQIGTIDGTLFVDGTSTFSAANSVTTVNGVVNITGTATTPITGTIATLKFAAGSTLNYSKSGGTITTADYNVNSTVNIAGVINSSISWPSSTPAGNLIYNSTGSAAQTLGSTLTAINGSLTIENTGTGSFGTGTGTGTIVTIAGPATLNGGSWIIAGNTITMTSGLTQNGGLINKTSTSAVTWNTTHFTQNAGTVQSSVAGLFTLNISGNLTQSAGATIDGGASGGMVAVFNGAVAQTASVLGTVPNKVNVTIGTISPVTTTTVTFASDLGVGTGNTLLINSGSQLVMAPGRALTIAGTGTFGGNSVTLRSDATGTARIAAVTGTITGAANVTIERFIPASGNRAWRLLSAPLQAAGAPAIFNSWQDGGSSSATHGTHITQLGGAGTNGFDASKVALNNSSIKYYDGTNLITPAATNTGAITDNGAAYFLFVRGNRAIDLNDPSQSGNTTLRMTGTPNFGAVTTGVAGTNFSLIPNPYPSAVDYEAILTGNPTLTGVYYIWDATLGTIGAYRTVERTAANTYQQTPAGGSTTADNTARYLQSGQAFFVPGSATLNFAEDMKTDQSPAINVYRTNNGAEEIVVNLKIVNGATTLADAVRAKYDAGYSARVSSEDINKLSNFTENLAIGRNGSRLAVEKRPFIVAYDTIFLKLNNTIVRTYQFEVNPVNFTPGTLNAFLEDAYLGTSTPISLATISTFDFSVTGDAASANEDRFRIVFNSGSVLPVDYMLVKAVQKGDGVQVEWTVGSERTMRNYIVERSTDGIRFDQVGDVAARANNNDKVSYAWFDANPVQGKNFYRIKAIANTGNVKYSQAVIVSIGGVKSDIVVYPNPVKGNTISLQFSNQPQGIYTIKLFSSVGQELFLQKIEHLGGSATQTINLGKAISKGVYYLNVTNGEMNVTQQLINN